MPFDPKDLLLYPEEPGVYLMRDREGRVLYVGKAKNLRSRLKHYFVERGDSRPMIPYLRAQLEKIDTIVALTEKDALLLENTLIKKHQPKYNVMLKDDKSFIGLELTRHRWPMLKLVRHKGPPKKGGAYFGPYTSAHAARETFDLIQRLFPLRQCSDQELMQRKRPCLLYDIKRCSAPCVEKCTPEEYGSYVEGAVRLLKGQDREVLSSLKRQMEEAAEALEFEKADRLLAMIRQIEHVTQIQHVDNPEAFDCDAIGLYREADALMIARLEFREGRLVASEHYSFHAILSDDDEAVASFLLQHYRGRPSYPASLLLPFPLKEQMAVAEILSEQAGRKISLHAPKIGKKRELIEMARRNAKAQFIREEDSRHLAEKRLLDLQETLRLTRFPRRIDCVDTSNLAGSDPVASLVSFVNGERDKSHTRLFKVRGSDDYTAMREALLRHFSRQKDKGEFCDLLIVDGGRGQLHLALEVFEELGIASIDVIGVSKEASRHDKGLTQEKIHLAREKEPLAIPIHSPTLFLLQKIRDEAHRVAIGYHRKRRSARLISSALDDLPGIGPVKKRRLFEKFGSVERLLQATDEEILAVERITRADLAAIRNLRK
jgi:excinuclease ABC subunit C